MLRGMVMMLMLRMMMVWMVNKPGTNSSAALICNVRHKQCAYWGSLYKISIDPDEKTSRIYIKIEQKGEGFIFSSAGK